MERERAPIPPMHGARFSITALSTRSDSDAFPFVMQGERGTCVVASDRMFRVGLAQNGEFRASKYLPSVESRHLLPIRLSGVGIRLRDDPQTMSVACQGRG